MQIYDRCPEQERCWGITERGEEKFTLAPFGFHELFDGEWEVKTNHYLEFPSEQGGDGRSRARMKMLRKGREIEM